MNLVTRRPYGLFSGLYNPAFDNRQTANVENRQGGEKNWVPEVDIFED
jgi:hypothetical protein